MFNLYVVVVVLLLTANKVVFVCLFVCFNINLYWCNLLIHVVSMIIVRSV